MEELSIKQKAKRYDEALEKAKNWYVDSQIDFKKSLENLFPELKESEDERIRKEILQELNNSEDSIILTPLKQKRWIAWVEKQGEHAKFRDSIQVGDKVTRNEDGVLVNLSQLKRVAKPAEKFPKYEKGDILTDGKNKYEVLSWDYTETGIAAYYMKGVGCKFSWSCEEADKKLKPLEQKPAWSEEDEKDISEAAEYIRKYSEYVVGGNSKQYVLDLADRIESIIPQITWKPSGEQMKILNEVLNFAANHESPHWNDYIFGTLNNLIRQLKKL